jgi:hypothetical protein
MAYFIFLKSLESLEDFKKNPHVQIFSKSPCAIFFEVLPNSENQSKNRKYISFTFGPFGLSCQNGPPASPAHFPSSAHQPRWSTDLGLLVSPSCPAPSLLLPHTDRALSTSSVRCRATPSLCPPRRHGREPSGHALSPSPPLLATSTSPSSDNQRPSMAPHRCLRPATSPPSGPYKKNALALPHSTTAAPTILSSRSSPQRPPHRVPSAAATSHHRPTASRPPGLR